MKNIKKKIVVVIQSILAVDVFALILSNFLQMLARYFFSFTVYWVEDISILGLYWVFGLGTPMAWLMGQHMEMDLISKRMSPTFQMVLNYIIQVVGIVFGICFIAFGRKSIRINKGFVMSIVGFDEMWRYVPVVVCGVLLTISAILNIIDLTIDKIKAKEVQI